MKERLYSKEEFYRAQVEVNNDVAKILDDYNERKRYAKRVALG